MEEPENLWVVFLTVGMAFTVIGLLLLDSAVWFVQYGALILGILLSVVALYLERSTPSQA